MSSKQQSGGVQAGVVQAPGAHDLQLQTRRVPFIDRVLVLISFVKQQATGNRQQRLKCFKQITKKVQPTAPHFVFSTCNRDILHMIVDFTRRPRVRSTKRKQHLHFFFFFFVDALFCVVLDWCFLRGM